MVLTRPNNILAQKSRHGRSGCIWLVLLVMAMGLLACGSSARWNRAVSQTPVAVGVQVHSDGAAGVTSVALRLTPVNKVAYPPLLPSPSPLPTVTLTPSSVPGTRRPATPPLELPTAPASPSPPAAVLRMLAYPGEITPRLQVLEPAAGLMVPAGIDQMEFKWVWDDEGMDVCKLPAGYGFEIRIWPNPDSTANPHLPESARPAIAPMAAVDAATEQQHISQSCDLDDHSRRYNVQYLSRTPGVSLAQGKGHFFWDVAYVQLEPYQPLWRSAPRDFVLWPD